MAARTVRAQPTLVKEGSDAEMNCMICMDRPINTIILPCGHQVHMYRISLISPRAD